MAKRYKITCKEGDVSFSCADDEAVFKAMIHAGLGPLRHGCCGGGCGICRMRIVSGEYHSFKAMSAAHVSDADKKEDIVLICCVQPRSDLVIARV
jgi:ferredoxin